MNYDTAQEKISTAKNKIQEANKEILEVLKDSSHEYENFYIETLHDASKQLSQIKNKI